MQRPSDILGPDGPFATQLEGFAPRAPQQEMADAVFDALKSGQVLVAEAGTGTGKTLAYLVPALLSGLKVIVSTGTKNLQDQLFNKDLPLVRKALGLSVDVALLKGRANYLCRHRLDVALNEGLLFTRQQQVDLQKVRTWSGTTQSGDIAESRLAEDAAIWPIVTSTADNCLGGECPVLNQCHLVLARRRAQEADVVVVNHHLLFADLAMREEGFGELLPGANAFILDEAHQVPETASNFFGLTLTGNQLLELAHDTVAEDLKEAGDDRRVRDAAEALEKAARDLRLAFGTEQRRGGWHEVANSKVVNDGLAQLEASLVELCERLGPIAPRGKGLEGVERRARELLERLRLLTAPPPEQTIHWFETHTRSFSINHTPLEVARQLREQMEAQARAWIFTSATLAVGESFDHFMAQMGIETAQTHQWGSPFNFPHQALLYLPENLPLPTSPEHTRAVLDAALPLLTQSRGRAFLLFTSHRALREAAEELREKIDYPLLVQGDEPRGALLERFRALGNAVLLGTGSFWEGVDVRGEALSCVIIDKLPFASPGDPVLQARLEAMRRNGGNPFMEFQLPQAVITLKQGVGRLIRDVTDYGVLAICDRRLVDKPYGQIFLDALPPMTRTRRPEVIERFFRYHRGEIVKENT